MKIREMQSEDIDKVIKILNDNYNFVMNRYHSKKILEEYKLYNTIDSWHNQLRWKTIFIVEEQNDVLATCSIANFGSLEEPKYCLNNFFVTYMRHRKGLGKFLLKHILNYAKGHNFSYLHVPSTRSGFEFYKKMGFVEYENDRVNEITWMRMEMGYKEGINP
ncbi:MAG: N-acetylglutamate synthase [Bacillales bacterium]|jgi:N-acetylglutamate synthase-like GNAT family acetyltransferase|nr:N-acetylglutamate synthase [Bacillales bacterium]